jgi:nucleotide-binding universal stress UspA family protein
METLNISRILVPVDYSEYANTACNYALKLACKHKAEIKIFHTYYSPSLDLIGLSGATETQTQLRGQVITELEETEKKTAEELVDSMQNSCSAMSMPHSLLSYHIVPGIPEDEILKYSKAYKPDIVVMGTRGKNKTTSIIGSVTEKVIEKVPFPILAIPENYNIEQEGDLKGIMYITNFDESDFMSITKLMKFSNALDLKIHCIHLADEKSNWDQIKLDGLKKYFKKVYKKKAVKSSIISTNNLFENIDNYVRKEKMSVISITSTRKNLIAKLFGSSLTKKLFYHTNIPLLVFHA